MIIVNDHLIVQSFNCFRSLGLIKLSDSTFQAFNNLENRKQMTQIKQNANNKANVDINNSNDNDNSDKKASKNKVKKKTEAPKGQTSPKASAQEQSHKPQSFEQIARQVLIGTITKSNQMTAELIFFSH